MVSICHSACSLARCAVFAWMFGFATSAVSAVWWDDFPRVVSTSSVSDAQAYSATANLNGVASDPGWGLWFTYANDSGVGASNTCSSFQAAGIVSLSYNEGYGQLMTPIVELQWSWSLQRWTPRHHFWNWQQYSNGPIAWAGAWSWFDSFTNDLPFNQTEASYFARPFTRMNAAYGGEPMLYPNGAIATGFLNQDTHATDPRNSRVYDAGASKTIYGALGDLDYSYNSLASAATQPHAGELWIPATTRYSGLLNFGRDAACPCWTNLTRAQYLSAVQLTGSQGSWTDNVSPWDSFMAGGPVSCAFGEWSVALFRNYLTNQFTTNQLASWGVLAASAPLTSITNFDVRAYFLTVASNQFGLASTNLADAAWDNSGWLNQSVWNAFKIFRRQNGSAALTNYDQNVHAAAALGGQTNFALLANDILPAAFGWARGNFDLASSELSLGWNLTAGPRGFGLPPFERLAPLYKAAREHGRSRFVTIWLYNDGYPAALTNRGPVQALFYEMLATHTLPKIIIGDSHFAGTPAIQTDFLRFVAQSAAPAFASRVPIEEVGIYLSTSSILSTALPGDASNFAAQDHQYAVWGWGTALSELHYQYRIVPEWKLNTNLLQTLKVLIIPNADAFEPGDVPTLQTWVANGGCLIVTGDSGSRLGEAGNFNQTTHNLVLAPVTSVTNLDVAPAAITNILGLGTVYYLKTNVGRVYYDTDAKGRDSQRATFAAALSNAFAAANAKPALNSSNAPATVGLTLYQDSAALKTFVDLNNFNVDTRTYVTTPTPVVNIDLALPAWLAKGIIPMATIVSPDGSLSVSSLSFDANRVHLQLPSVTNYLSVILQPTPGAGAWAVDAGGNWSDTNKWSGGNVPIGIGSTAVFRNDITGDRIVTNDAPRVIGNLVFGDADTNSAGGWTISGSSGLTLHVSNGTPLVSIGALAAGKSVTISAPLAGTQGLALNAAGTLMLSGTNTYSGPTTISAGTLALSGNGTIANSTLISITNGAHFDVSGKTGGFALGDSQTLSNSAASTGTIAGNLNTSSGAMSVSYANGTSAFIVNNGTLTLGSNTLFTINNTGAALGSGSYKIISTNTGGWVADASLPSVTVSGSGLAAGMSAALAANNGELVLVVTSLTSTNAYLRSLVLNPAGLTSTFVSNTFSYTATNAYGSTPTVTVTNADVTAANKLICNATPIGILTSGVPSMALSLNPNPALTNVVQVLVKAQDGVTTKTYTVNVTQLPSLTKPVLAINSSGGVLTLNWPLANLGYWLLVQTNNLSGGVSSNQNDWATVPGSTATSTASITNLTTNLNEYYRLVYP